MSHVTPTANQIRTNLSSSLNIRRKLDLDGHVPPGGLSDAVVGDENVAVVVQRDVDRLLQVVVADGGDRVPVQADLGHSLRAPVDHNLDRLGE